MQYTDTYVNLLTGGKDAANGYDKIWILGDEFVANTANQYFKTACSTLMNNSRSTGTYCGDKFEILLFHSTQYVSNFRNMIARLVNTLIQAINSEPLLPRAIVVVLDDDLIKFININGFGMSMAYSRILHYLFSEFNKIIAARKDILPLKAKCLHYPELIWVNPPFNTGFVNNPQRNKFSKALDSTAAIYADNWSLQLKRIWDTQGRDLYLPRYSRFTSKGLMTYWMAVDRSVRFWDTALSPLNRRTNPTTTPVAPKATHKKRGCNKFKWFKNKDVNRNKEE